MRAAVSIGRAPRPDIPTAALRLDFANGVYRKDGVTDTFSALGGTTSGAPSINSSGLLCSSSGQSLQIPYTHSGQFLTRVVTEADTSGAAASNAVLWRDTDGPALARLFKFTSSITSFFTSDAAASTGGSALPITSTRFVFGFTNGALRSSANGSTPSVGPLSATFSFSPGQIIVGNDDTGTQPWGKRIRSVEVFLGDFTDDVIQDLSL
jgi:hypothetical protein